MRDEIPSLVLVLTERLANLNEYIVNFILTLNLLIYFKR